MTPCGIRNILPVSFLSAGIATELGIRPCWRKSVATGFADAIFSFLRTPPFQFLLITMVAAQRVQAIFLGFDLCIKHSAAAFAVNLSDSEIGGFSGKLLFIQTFQIVLIFIFPLVVVNHSYILHNSKNIEEFSYPSITEGMRRLDFFQSFKKFLKFSGFLRLTSESKRKERYCVYYT